MKKRNIFGLFMAAALTLFATSCGKADDREGFASMELTPENALTITEFMEHDATAAYPMTLSIALVDGQIVVRGGECHPVLDQVPQQNTFATEATIADYGKTGSLKSVKEIPTTGYTTSVAPQEEHGYVVKAVAKGNLNAYNNAAIHDPADLYVRIYIEEATENGYTIRYQYPFVVED